MQRVPDGTPNAGALSVKHADGTEEHLGTFALEPSAEPGHVPERVIDELRQARTTAKDYAQAFADAVKAQAEKYRVKPGALRRYVTALEADKLEELDAETDDLDRLIG